MKKKKVFMIILIVLVLSVAVFVLRGSKPKLDTIVLTINSQVFILESATTLGEYERGLMYRQTIPEDRGMIFIFDRDETRAFWMKNVLIPLDMIFVNSTNYIVDINYNAQPCVEGNECAPYSSLAHSKYVLEFNAGVAEELNLEIGQNIDLVI